jgi:putative resolvase
MDKRLVKIGEAAKLLGTSVGNLRKWEKSGELLPARKTQGGTRYYDAAELLGLKSAEAATVGYARAAGPEAGTALARQAAVLEGYCAARGWRCELVQDVGSGMDYRRPGLAKLVEMILGRRVKRLVLTHQESLARFGADLVFALCALRGVEVVLVHQGEAPGFEADLAGDLFAVVAALSARLYGSRSAQQRRLLRDLQASADRIGREYGLYGEEP